MHSFSPSRSITEEKNPKQLYFITRVTNSEKNISWYLCNLKAEFPIIYHCITPKINKWNNLKPKRKICHQIKSYLTILEHLTCYQRKRGWKIKTNLNETSQFVFCEKRCLSYGIRNNTITGSEKPKIMMQCTNGK